MLRHKPAAIPVLVLILLALVSGIACAEVFSGGAYKVGTDIPAGSYTVTVEDGSTYFKVWGAARDDMRTNGGLLMYVELLADANPTLGKVMLAAGNVIDFKGTVRIEKYQPVYAAIDASMEIPCGRYTVGYDLPAGEYSVEIKNGSTNLTVWGAIYNDERTNGGLLLDIGLSADKNPTLRKLVLEEGNVIDFTAAMIFTPYHVSAL